MLAFAAAHQHTNAYLSLKAAYKMLDSRPEVTLSAMYSQVQGLQIIIVAVAQFCCPMMITIAHSTITCTGFHFGSVNL